MSRSTASVGGGVRRPGIDDAIGSVGSSAATGVGVSARVRLGLGQGYGSG